MRLAAFIVTLAALGAPLIAQETGTVAVSEGAAENAAEAAQAESEGDATGLEIIEAGETPLSEYLWTRRPIVVFADTPADPRFSEQLEFLTARPGALIDRDVVVITDTNPDAQTPARTQLRPRGFQLVLIGKDGEVKLRKPFPWDVRELTRSIDKMPLRQDEIRRGRQETQ